MRTLLALICMLAIGAFSGISSPAQAQSGMLTGEMADSNALLGGPWNCTTAVPAMMGQPAHTEKVMLTFEVVPGNVFHDHVSGSMYAGDDYFGYSSKTKTYWSASADNEGSYGAATSTDGKTYTGTSSMGPVSMSVTSTYGRVSDSKITLHQIMSGGGQQATIDSSCTR